ncbi:hypothetical protein BGZ65_010874, partial [Modicella reniformis]
MPVVFQGTREGLEQMLWSVLVSSITLKGCPVFFVRAICVLLSASVLRKVREIGYESLPCSDTRLNTRESLPSGTSYCHAASLWTIFAVFSSTRSSIQQVQTNFQLKFS